VRVSGEVKERRKVKDIGFWLLFCLVIVILVGVLVTIVLGDSNNGLSKFPSDLSVSDIAYKTDAVTDRETRYYFITTDGERHRVTRHLYDIYTEIPTEIPAGCK